MGRWSKTIVRLPLFVDLEQVELDRVINAVNSFVPVSLAPADECYWEEILQIRNNNSECFTSAEPIGKQDHWCFMAKHSHTYRVALRKGKVVGFIGHVNRDARLAVREKGSGVAKFMWGAFVEEVGDLGVKVLPGNKRRLPALMFRFLFLHGTALACMLLPKEKTLQGAFDLPLLDLINRASSDFSALPCFVFKLLFNGRKK